jgi:hypothetical protein
MASLTFKTERQGGSPKKHWHSSSHYNELYNVKRTEVERESGYYWYAEWALVGESDAAIVPVWIALSSAIIIYNSASSWLKSLNITADVFQSICTQIWAFLMWVTIIWSFVFRTDLYSRSSREFVRLSRPSLISQAHRSIWVLLWVESLKHWRWRNQALGTRILRMTTNLMDGLDNVPMTVSVYAEIHQTDSLKRELYVKSILPIGVLFSGSLILSNSAWVATWLLSWSYLDTWRKMPDETPLTTSLSVSFIQMLKAFTPVAILLISAIFKIQGLPLMVQSLILSSQPQAGGDCNGQWPSSCWLEANDGSSSHAVAHSVCWCLESSPDEAAAYGEVHFEMFGFLCQASAVLVSEPVFASGYWPS